MSIKRVLLASDFDGTLKRGIVEKEDVESIDYFRSKKNHFCIVTGRAVNMIQKELEFFNLTYDYLICNNGSFCINFDRDVVYSFNLNDEKAVDLLRFLEEQNTYTFGFSNGTQYARKSKENFKSHNSHLEFRVVDDFETLLKNGVYNSIFFRHINEVETKLLLDKVKKKYIDYFDFHYNAGTVDVTAKGINKAIGIDKLLEHLDVDRIIVFGDNYNDIEMIKKFNGYCISTGVDELKLVASKVFNSISEVIKFIQN